MEDEWRMKVTVCVGTEQAEQAEQSMNEPNKQRIDSA